LYHFATPVATTLGIFDAIASPSHCALTLKGQLSLRHLPTQRSAMHFGSGSRRTLHEWRLVVLTVEELPTGGGWGSKVRVLTTGFQSARAVEGRLRRRRMRSLQV